MEQKMASKEQIIQSLVNDYKYTKQQLANTKFVNEKLEEITETLITKLKTTGNQNRKLKETIEHQQLQLEIFNNSKTDFSCLDEYLELKKIPINKLIEEDVLNDTANRLGSIIDFLNNDDIFL